METKISNLELIMNLFTSNCKHSTIFTTQCFISVSYKYNYNNLVIFMTMHICCL